MISSFGLAVRYDGAVGEGGGAVPENERQWLCTCRMHRCGDAGLTEEDWAEFPVVAKYRLSFMPPGLFPRFQAAQILDPLLKSEARSALVVGDGRLAMTIRSALGGEVVRLQVAIAKREGETGVWVAATSVPVLRGLCVLLEALLAKAFIGVDCSTEVEFPCEGKKFVWKVPPRGQSLGSIVSQKRWDLRIASALAASANSTGARDKLLNITVRDVLGSVHPGFFLSHSWKDASLVHAPHLVAMIEDASREMVRRERVRERGRESVGEREMGEREREREREG